MKIAFIGLGIMGRPMAGHLKAAGHDITVVDRASLTAEDRAAFAVAADAAAATAGAEVAILMVPDTPDVETVLFGAKGVAEGLKPGTLVIDMSSISPTATKGFAEKIAAKGGDYLDAPVSGGEVGAKQASLTIMVGGTEAAFAKAKPLFDAMGKNVTLVGDVGAGQTCKVANQIIVALTIEAVAEALTFASKAGADPAKVRQAALRDRCLHWVGGRGPRSRQAPYAVCLRTPATWAGRETGAFRVVPVPDRARLSLP